MPNNDYAGFGDFMQDDELKVDGTQKPMMPLFLLVDTSGSMEGPKIEQVKSAIEQIKMELGSMNTTNDDADIRISVLCFNSGAQWEAQFEDPYSLSTQFNVGGLTSMGKAFTELETMLSRSKFSQAGQFSSYKRAVMILLTDGIPTDDINSGIAVLRRNNWFVKGTRIAFAIGDDADTECLKKFTGNIETVLRVEKINLLSGLLANVAVVSSSTATHAPGLNADDSLTQQQKDLDFENSGKDSANSVKDAIESMVVTGEMNEKEAEEVVFDGWDA